jgi:hypothetical protein
MNDFYKFIESSERLLKKLESNRTGKTCEQKAISGNQLRSFPARLPAPTHARPPGARESFSQYSRTGWGHSKPRPFPPSTPPGRSP